MYINVSQEVATVEVGTHDMVTSSVSWTTSGTVMGTENNVAFSTERPVVRSTSNPDELTWDDATWILTSSFIIFTMQSGFGLLEAGIVTVKNEVNILVKNAADVIFGGLTYWMFGYGLSFGDWPEYSNPFVGVGHFFVDTQDMSEVGIVFSNFIFQLSFATTATTIVSGAMAERTKLTAYCLFSFLNTVVYAVPAHWIWAESGFLSRMGCIDIAGSGGVHLVGGVAGLVGTMMLGPRLQRYDNGYSTPSLGNPTNALVGMFMLWWGWLGFNCGSTFGISGGKWKLAAKSAVTTINASIGGGAVGMAYSFVFRNRKYEVADLINSVLGGLVSITAGCAVTRPWEAVVIGMIGGLIAIVCVPVFDRLKIDDPVSAASIHGCAGIWGMLAVGLFVDVDPIENLTSNRRGLFKGGGFYILGVQALACVCIIIWAAIITFILLFGIQKTIGLRLTEQEEILGCDIVEHGIDSRIDFSVVNETPGPLTTSNASRYSIKKAEISPVDTVSYGGGTLNPESHMVSIHRRRSSFGIIRTEVTPSDQGGPFTPMATVTISTPPTDTVFNNNNASDNASNRRNGLDGTYNDNNYSSLQRRNTDSPSLDNEYI